MTTYVCTCNSCTTNTKLMLLVASELRGSRQVDRRLHALLGMPLNSGPTLLAAGKGDAATPTSVVPWLAKHFPGPSRAGDWKYVELGAATIRAHALPAEELVPRTAPTAQGPGIFAPGRRAPLPRRSTCVASDLRGPSCRQNAFLAARYQQGARRSE